MPTFIGFGKITTEHYATGLSMMRSMQTRLVHEVQNNCTYKMNKCLHSDVKLFPALEKGHLLSDTDNHAHACCKMYLFRNSTFLEPLEETAL